MFESFSANKLYLIMGWFNLHKFFILASLRESVHTITPNNI